MSCSCNQNGLEAMTHEYVSSPMPHCQARKGSPSDRPFLCPQVQKLFSTKAANIKGMGEDDYALLPNLSPSAAGHVAAAKV